MGETEFPAQFKAGQVRQGHLPAVYSWVTTACGWTVSDTAAIFDQEPFATVVITHDSSGASCLKRFVIITLQRTNSDNSVY